MSQGNNGLNAGPISANDLMTKLAKASKVMQKVEGGNFTRGNVNESMFSEGYDDGGYTQQSAPQPQLQQNQYSTPDFDVSKIQNPKLHLLLHK